MAAGVNSAHDDTTTLSRCSWAWKEPLCLVKNTADMGLEVDQETLARLRQVTVPVVSVSVVGLYRTGKSYIMNILAGKDENTTGKLHGSTS